MSVKLCFLTFLSVRSSVKKPEKPVLITPRLEDVLENEDLWTSYIHQSTRYRKNYCPESCDFARDH